VSRFEWFRERFSAPPGAAMARGSQPGTGRTGQRGVLLTASSAATVLVAGIAIAAVAAPGHAAGVSATDRTAFSSKAAAQQPTTPLQIVSVTPAANSQRVNGGDQVTVEFNQQIATNSPMPTLSPHIAGSWQAVGDDAVFTPAAGFLPDTKVTLKIPGGASGVQAAGTAQSSVPGAGLLASSAQDTFTTGSYSTLRLQELLSELGYLPLNWTATGTNPAAGNANGQVKAAYDAPTGTFTWASGYPAILRTFWLKGKGNLITEGAIRSFEWQQGLTMDGDAGPKVWSHLLLAISSDTANEHGYTYALASKNSPETLTIWHNGRQVLRTLANTGISAAPTADGTFPVYLRYYYQVMKGKNPDGTPYADPVYYVSYFSAGEAVHYFPRASYGYPQSLGCVELPWAAAAKAWPYLTCGSLVTVQAAS
jgi:L,D-transpeptidase catalytic domain/Bacterial Ig-like domain